MPAFLWLSPLLFGLVTYALVSAPVLCMALVIAVCGMTLQVFGAGSESDLIWRELVALILVQLGYSSGFLISVVLEKMRAASRDSFATTVRNLILKRPNS